MSAEPISRLPDPADAAAPPPHPANRGPWLHRLMVRTFAVLFGVLIYWLLGFVLADIGNLTGPEYAEFEARLLDQSLIERSAAVADEIAEVTRQTGALAGRQRAIGDAAESSQRTLNQMLELQRLSLERDIAFGEDNQKALLEGQQQFLANQRRYQELSEQLATLGERAESLRRAAESADDALRNAREPVRHAFQAALRRHNLKVGAIKLTFLVPLLALAIGCFLRYRTSSYATLVYPFGIAVMVKVFAVMHQHFPSPYFKYILIGTSLLIVLRILVHLIGLVARPKLSWLLRQYRDAYDSFACPVCDFPIRRGPLRYMSWTRRSLRRHPPLAAAALEETYTCPSCTTELYGKCERCGGVRHALLPACQHCGAIETVAAR